MARVARLEIPGGWYHIINRGHQRGAIFRDRRCYEDFLKRLGQLPQRFGVRIHSYVLMPNHYHVQMKLGVAPALSRAMHWLNTGYGIWFNRRFGRVGALKRAEKQSEPLEKSCLTQRREILRDYEWSSYRAYAGLVEAPKWLSLEEVRERSGLSQRKYPPRTGSAYQ